MIGNILLIIVGIITYALIGYSVYKEVFKNSNNTKFEKIYFSLIWPLLIPLYIIHIINKLG